MPFVISVLFLFCSYSTINETDLESELDYNINLPNLEESFVAEEDSAIDVYIFSPKLQGDGSFDPDSTGLIAFPCLTKNFKKCPQCSLAFFNKGKYVKNSLLSEQGVKLSTFPKLCAKNRNKIPQSFLCSRCNKTIGIFVLNEKKESNFGIQLSNTILSDTNKKLPQMKLIIKADKNACYGRVFQAVQVSKNIGYRIVKHSIAAVHAATDSICLIPINFGISIFDSGVNGSIIAYLKADRTNSRFEIIDSGKVIISKGIPKTIVFEPMPLSGITPKPIMTARDTIQFFDFKDHLENFANQIDNKSDTLFISGDMKTLFWKFVRIIDVSKKLGFHYFVLLPPLN